MNSEWSKLKLSKATQYALKKLNFKKPKPIQFYSIPKFMEKKDVVAQAVTGSGKTLAFIIPIVELLNLQNVKKDAIFSIVLTPTSELAKQTFQMFNDFLTHFKGTKPEVSIFQNKVGQSIPVEIKADISEEDKEKITGTVLIATPGALSKFIDEHDQRNKFIKRLKSVEILILDEADRLLDSGFEAQFGSILRNIPKQRVTGLFSATQISDVEVLKKIGMRQAKRIYTKVETTNIDGKNTGIPENLTNYYTIVEENQKLPFLKKFIEEHKSQKIIVFFSACNCVDYFYRVMNLLLPKTNFLRIHKKMKKKRSSLFQQFREMKEGVMLCTDLMARGVDVPNIDWVVHFDPPKASSDFVHRSGRTARGDASGETLLMLRSTEDAFVNFLSVNQEVHISEFEAQFDSKTLESLDDQIKRLCCQDRLLYEKSIQAYISFVNFYRNHELKYIFHLKDLDMGELANSFGLLRLPQMKEMKDKDLTSFKPTDINLKTLVFKDKVVRNSKIKSREYKHKKMVEQKEKEDDESMQNVENKKTQKLKRKQKNTEEGKSGVAGAKKRKIDKTENAMDVDIPDVFKSLLQTKKKPKEAKQDTELKGMLATLNK